MALCWDTAIYPFKHESITNKWYHSGLLKAQDNSEYTLETTPQYIITIPPHKEDFEVRVLLERHMSEFVQDDK